MELHLREEGVDRRFVGQELAIEQPRVPPDQHVADVEDHRRSGSRMARSCRLPSRPPRRWQCPRARPIARENPDDIASRRSQKSSPTLHQRSAGMTHELPQRPHRLLRAARRREPDGGAWSRRPTAITASTGATSTSRWRRSGSAMRCAARGRWAGAASTARSRTSSRSSSTSTASPSRREIIGAVNCVVARDGRLVGENTDGKGFVASLAGVVPLAGARVVILGAGGAARAIAVETGARRRRGDHHRQPQPGARRGAGRAGRRPHPRRAAFRPGTASWRSPRAPTSWSTPPRSASSPTRRRRPWRSPPWRPATLVADVIPNPPHTRFLAPPRRAAAAPSTATACWSSRRSPASTTGPASASTGR